jgi:uncharacterized protein YqjF (DUF2071 family)
VTPEAPILPWPRILRQTWLDLSFLHWAVEPASIAHLYPPDTEPDTFEGSSFVGVVPFQMAETGFARGPALFGTFLETNVRLYSVDRTGRRGVVFLALDTTRLDMIAAGRWIFGVPYRWARMSYGEQGRPSHLHLDAAMAGSRCVELRRGEVGRSADVRTARAFSDRSVGLTRRSRGSHVVSAQQTCRLAVAGRAVHRAARLLHCCG